MRLSAFVSPIPALVAAACVMALLPCGAAAQQVGGGVKAGVTLGDIPNIDQVLNATYASTSQRIGWAAGGFLMVRWKNGFAVQPEVLYTQKGVKVSGIEGAGSGDAWVKTDFLDVPILARYTIGKGVRGYVFAGPSFDFKVSAKVKASLLGQSDEEDISSDVKSFEFAIVVGGGVEFGPILLEARWSEGLTDIAKDTSDETGPAVKTRTFLFLGGLRF
jgi:hypothetical protein